jgi:flagellar hook assembly protein FlgD
VYRQELKKYLYPKDTTIFIGSLSFSLGSSSSLVKSSLFVQSGCNNVVQVEQKETTPQAFTGLTNHPNPFNSSTTISFFILRSLSQSIVELTVYDEQGRRIKQLLKSLLSPGEHTVRWDATNDDDQPVASGVYFYHLTVGSQRQIGKMSYVK